MACSTMTRRCASRIVMNTIATAPTNPASRVVGLPASSLVTAAAATSSMRATSSLLAQRTRRSFASDTHDDFKPKSNVESSDDVARIIAQDVESNGVIIYMKGSPAAPQCGFSNMACRILDHHGVTYASRNVLASEEFRNGIKTFSSWPTIPQIFVKGEFLGGSDILMQMHQSGELATMFEGLPKSAP